MSGRLTIQHFMAEQDVARSAAENMRDRIAAMLDGCGPAAWPNIKPHILYRVRGSELTGVFPALAELVRTIKPE